MGNRSGPSRAWYGVAVVLILAALVSVVWEIFFIISLVGGGTEFLAPGRKKIDISEPGRYVVWYKNRTMYEGRTYSSDAQLPDGTTITVLGPPYDTNGIPREMPVTPSTGTSVQSGLSESHSVCTFEAARPGRYIVEVAGLAEPRVILVRRAFLTRLVITIVACGLVQFFGLLGGPALIVLVAVLRFRARKRQLSDGTALSG